MKKYLPIDAIIPIPVSFIYMSKRALTGHSSLDAARLEQGPFRVLHKTWKAAVLYVVGLLRWT